MKGSIAAGLAAGANFLAGRLQSEYEMEQKQKLYQMQQDAEMKRQMFLEKYRADLDEENAAKKYEREKDDVVGTFKDPETGTYFGRTKSGGSVPLHATSEDYQSDLAAERDNKVEKGKLGLTAEQARIDRMRKQVEDYDSKIAKREQPTQKASKEPKDPDENYIRGQYNKMLHEAQYPIDPTTGKPTTAANPNFNRAQADADIRSSLSERYSQEKVNKILGSSVKDQVAQGFDKPAPQQKQAPSPEALMQAANEAIKRGAPQDQVEARLKQLMAQYGYSPQ